MEKKPLKFIPYLKSVIWGGEKICRYKGITQPEPNIGESWEISAVPGHESIVAEGTYKGESLTELTTKFGDELLGTKVAAEYAGKFPLLIKIIDANDNLSVQVHPDDKLAAQRHNSLGKTEMWYIIDADKDAKIYSGLNREMTADDYLRHVSEDTFESVLAVHDSHPGDVFFLPAGRVHAIGAGNLLAEIQESSDITYRIYDYNRRDAAGNPRELHTEQAKDAIDYTFHDQYKSEPASESEPDATIASCEHFHTRRLLLDGDMEFNFDRSSFTVIMCLGGSAQISNAEGSTHIAAGESVLIPAVMTGFKLSGKATILLCRS